MIETEAVEVPRPNEAVQLQHPVTAVINPLDMPVAKFKEQLARRKDNRKALMDWIKDALVEGVDYGRLHVVSRSKCPAGKNCTNKGHFSKPSLFKPGSEKILGMLGITPTWPTIYDYEQKALAGESIDNVVLRCEGVNSSGAMVGVGLGSRTVAKDDGDLNKSFKMCKKSGMIDMTLTLGGLSEIFTQDIEDMLRDSGQSTKSAEFDRNAKLDFGAHAEETWQKVDNKYLYGLSQQDSWRGKFAKQELEARKDKSSQPVPELKLFLDKMELAQITSLLFDRYGVDGVGALDVEVQNDLLLWLQAEGPVRELWGKVGDPNNAKILSAKFQGKSYRMLDPKEMESLGKLLTAFIADPDELPF